MQQQVNTWSKTQVYCLRRMGLLSWVKPYLTPHTIVKKIVEASNEIIIEKDRPNSFNSHLAKLKMLNNPLQQESNKQTNKIENQIDTKLESIQQELSQVPIKNSVKKLMFVSENKHYTKLLTGQQLTQDLLSFIDSESEVIQINYKNEDLSEFKETLLSHSNNKNHIVILPLNEKLKEILEQEFSQSPYTVLPSLNKLLSDIESKKSALSQLLKLT